MVTYIISDCTGFCNGISAKNKPKNSEIFLKDFQMPAPGPQMAGGAGLFAGNSPPGGQKNGRAQTGKREKSVEKAKRFSFLGKLTSSGEKFLYEDGVQFSPFCGHFLFFP